MGSTLSSVLSWYKLSSKLSPQQRIDVSSRIAPDGHHRCQSDWDTPEQLDSRGIGASTVKANHLKLNFHNVASSCHALGLRAGTLLPQSISLLPRLFNVPQHPIFQLKTRYIPADDEMHCIDSHFPLFFFSVGKRKCEKKKRKERTRKESEGFPDARFHLLLFMNSSFSFHSSSLLLIDYR